MAGADQYDDLFRAAGEEWNVDPTLLKALVIHESGGRSDARGASGEIGLAQLMPGTAAHLGVTNRYDPAQSIYGAAKYLHEAEGAEGDNPAAVLRYYNAGPGWRSVRSDPNYPSYVGGQYRKLTTAGGVQYAKIDTGTATDAAPAPAQGGDAVAKAPDKGGDDDAFTRALNAKEAPAADSGKGGGSSETEPDAFTRALGKPATDTSEPPTHGWLVRNALALGSGAYQGAADVVHTGANLASWADQRVPALAALDKRYGIDPAAAANALETERQAFEASPEGQSVAGTIGRMGGQAIATAPLLGPVAGTAELGTGAVLRGASGLVPWLIRTAGQGAAVGAGFGAATSGASDAPLGEQIAGGAEAGAIAGPAFDAAGRIVRPVVNALAGGGRTVGGVLWTPGERAPPVAAAPTEEQALAARVAQATGRPPPGAQTAAPTEPQAAGAQWSGANGARIVGITPAEEAAYRVNAEGQKLIEPQPIGVPDRRALVEGVNPNLAEQEQQVNIARELKSLQIRSEDASQQAKEIAAEHNQARTTYMNNTTGSETDILRRTAQRQADIEQAKPIVFAPQNVTGPVDQAPIVAKIGQILDTPENRQNDAVQSVIRPLINRMVNEDGTAKITDPREWWGMRQQIDRWTSKRMDANDPNLHYAAHDLNEIAKVIDQQIEKVAPGYDAMIAKYAEHSRAIGAMRVLQDEAKKVYTSGGGTMRMTFEGVQRMMKHIVDMRNADPTDLNPYKQISPETMGRMWNLRDDLRRSASAIELAKTPGSDTAQNLWDMVRRLASGPEAQHALQAFAATHLGMPGYVGARALTGVVGAMRAGRQAARDTARAQEMLRPSHPLIDPNAP